MGKITSPDEPKSLRAGSKIVFLPPRVNTGPVPGVSGARQSLNSEYIGGDVAKSLQHRVFPGGHPSKY